MGTSPRRAIFVTALPIERDAVLAHLHSVREEQHPRGSLYRRGLFDDRSPPWEVLVAEVGAGNESAAAEVERAIGHYTPGVVVFVGVAGAIKDLAHGDVIASTKVYHYESGKDRDDRFEPRPEVELPGYPLRERARFEAGETRWRERIKAVGGTHGATRPPEAVVGPIASGPKVIASTRSALYKFIRQHYGDAQAVEMEGHGFLLGVRMNHPALGLVVRGMSDRLGDKTPSQDQAWQPVAAGNAAAFAFEILARFADPLPVQHEEGPRSASVGDTARAWPA